MKAARMNFVFWVSGVLAGVILMERWRRRGANAEPVTEPGADATATATDASAVVQPEKPKLSEAIIAGAKADAARIRGLVEQAIPSRFTAAKPDAPSEPSASSDSSDSSDPSASSASSASTES